MTTRRPPTGPRIDPLGWFAIACAAIVFAIILAVAIAPPAH